MGMRWINKIAISVVVMGMTLGVGGVASAQNPPVISWTINANGFLGQLVITAVDSQTGNLTGTVFGTPISGFWDGVSEKITFIRMINAANPATAQVFTGYMFNNATSQGQIYTLAGSFVGFRGTGGSAERELFGWYAESGPIF